MENVLMLANAVNANPEAFASWLAIAVLWTLPWKGYALWTAAHRKEKWWFVIMLVVNTLAVLEIIYIFFVAKKKDELAGFFKKIFGGK